MSQPTYEQAQLLLQLGQVFDSPENAAAFRWTYGEDFKREPGAYKPGSPGFDKIRTVLDALNLVGTYLKYDLIHEDLLFSQGLFIHIWERVGGYVATAREDATNPLAYRDAEALMQGSKAWKARELVGVGTTATQLSAASAQH